MRVQHIPLLNCSLSVYYKINYETKVHNTILYVIRRFEQVFTLVKYDFEYFVYLLIKLSIYTHIFYQLINIF